MSIDPSLKIASGSLAAVRSVLTRAERIKQLTEEKDYDAKQKGVLGLPKTRVARLKAGK